MGYKQEEIDKIDLASVSNEDFQQLLRDKLLGRMVNNGAKQRVIPESEIEKYLQQGYEFQAVLPSGKAIMKMPF